MSECQRGKRTFHLECSLKACHNLQILGTWVTGSFSCHQDLFARLTWAGVSGSDRLLKVHPWSQVTHALSQIRNCEDWGSVFGLSSWSRVTLIQPTLRTPRASRGRFTWWSRVKGWHRTTNHWSSFRESIRIMPHGSWSCSWFDAIFSRSMQVLPRVTRTEAFWKLCGRMTHARETASAVALFLGLQRENWKWGPDRSTADISLSRRKSPKFSRKNKCLFKLCNLRHFTIGWGLSPRGSCFSLKK